MHEISWRLGLSRNIVPKIHRIGGRDTKLIGIKRRADFSAFLRNRRSASYLIGAAVARQNRFKHHRCRFQLPRFPWRQIAPFPLASSSRRRPGGFNLGNDVRHVFERVRFTLDRNVQRVRRQVAATSQSENPLVTLQRLTDHRRAGGRFDFGRHEQGRGDGAKWRRGCRGAARLWRREQFEQRRFESLDIGRQIGHKATRRYLDSGQVAVQLDRRHAAARPNRFEKLASVQNRSPSAASPVSLLLAAGGAAWMYGSDAVLLAFFFGFWPVLFTLCSTLSTPKGV